MPRFVFMPPRRDVTRRWAQSLRVAVPELDVSEPDTDDEAAREIGKADAAFGDIPDALLSSAHKLRWLQAPAIAPPAGYYSDALVQHPVTVTNFRGIFNEHIAAHIMAFVLAFARGLHRYSRLQAKHEWRPDALDTGVVDLPSSTALIVGVGGIGAETARACVPFGLRVIGIDARRSDNPEGVAELHPPQALDDLLPQADFVILTIPHTPETEGLMNAARFARMKRSAFFINIGRGMTTRLDDLVAALNANQIAGAALDVYEQEPLPADHSLWDAPNTILTPHTAGYGPHLDARREAIIIDNARRFVRGDPLFNIVDKRLWF